MPLSADYWDQSIKSIIPEGDQNAFKIAFYNATVLAFLACCAAVITAVFCLLQAVLKSMLWAMLCGTVLFPFKKKVTETIEWYLVALKESGTPLFIGVFLSPLAALDLGAEALWSSIMSKSAAAFLIVYATAAAITYESNFIIILDVVNKVYNFLDSIIWLYSCGWVRALAIMYALCFIGYVYLIGADANKVAVRALSVPLWFVVLCTIAQFFGPLRVVVAVTSAVVILLIVLRVIRVGGDIPEANVAEKTTEAESTEKSKSAPMDEPLAPIESPPPTESFGNRCIRGIIGACSLLWVTKHPAFLIILFLLLIYSLMKRTSEYFDLRQRAISLTTSGVESFHSKFSPILEIFFPSTLRQFFKLLFYGDRHVIEGLCSSAGMLSTLFVMVTLLTTAILFGGFLIFQVQSEVMHLIGVTSSLINRNVSANQQLASWLTKAMNANDIDTGNLDTMVENVYAYGRVWLPQQARMLIKSDDPKRGEVMEEQVRQIVDKLYESWGQSRDRMSSDTKAMSVTSLSMNELWEHLQKNKDLRAMAMDLVGFVKENVGVFLSVLETAWFILSTNLTFIFSMSAAFLSILLNFGKELLNTIIGILVFLTMLYYLLAYSRSEWKPIEWIKMFTPGGEGSAGTTFSKSVETAISNVFILSFKMALFYGLYMWFIHSVFALNVTFLPSILAAILAAVPFLAPYWVCIPGAIELGLVRGEPLSAVLFFIFGFAPCMVVDAAFYREVKGSHPYLTGLSVVGGIYWLGLEGAFVGPILLCCMLVLMDMYKNVLPR